MEACFYAVDEVLSRGGVTLLGQRDRTDGYSKGAHTHADGIWLNGDRGAFNLQHTHRAVPLVSHERRQLERKSHLCLLRLRLLRPLCHLCLQCLSRYRRILLQQP